MANPFFWLNNFRGSYAPTVKLLSLNNLIARRAKVKKSKQVLVFLKRQKDSGNTEKDSSKKVGSG